MVFRNVADKLPRLMAPYSRRIIFIDSAAETCCGVSVVDK